MLHSALQYGGRRIDIFLHRFGGYCSDSLAAQSASEIIHHRDDFFSWRNLLNCGRCTNHHSRPWLACLVGIHFLKESNIGTKLNSWWCGWHFQSVPNIFLSVGWSHMKVSKLTLEKEAHAMYNIPSQNAAGSICRNNMKQRYSTIFGAHHSSPCRGWNRKCLDSGFITQHDPLKVRQSIAPTLP
jgi:hypothetical protein